MLFECVFHQCFLSTCVADIYALLLSDVVQLPTFRGCGFATCMGDFRFTRRLFAKCLSGSPHDIC